MYKVSQFKILPARSDSCSICAKAGRAFTTSQERVVQFASRPYCHDPDTTVIVLFDVL